MDKNGRSLKGLITIIYNYSFTLEYLGGGNGTFQLRAYCAVLHFAVAQEAAYVCHS